MKLPFTHYRKPVWFLSFVLSSVISVAQTADVAFRAKAKPELINDFNNGRNEFIVVFSEQADVSGSALLKTKEEKGAYVYRTLTSVAQKVQPAFSSLLSAKHIEYQNYWVVNAMFVKGDIELAKELAARPEVKELLANNRMVRAGIINPANEETIALRDATSNSVNAVEWGIHKVQADAVWALGYTGQGVVVGGQDTGYDWTHPAIKGKYRGWNGTTADHNYNWHDAIHTGTGNPCGVNTTAPCDDDSHGTHTMGTMVGDDGAGNQIGMAPGAKWIAARDMDQGNGTLNTYIECFQWFIAPTDLMDANATPSKAPDVINNSWGCPASEGCNTSNFATMEAVVNNVRASGIVVVVSAGNSGPNCNTVEDPAAIFDASFSVGSSNLADSMSNFSSRGNVSIDGSNRPKPDISAPGSQVRSSIPGNGYATYSGTSMAGPHVVGAVALLISAAPSLAGNVDSLERILEKTAVHILSNQTCNGTSPTTFPNNTVGYGRIDILAAVNYVLSFTGIQNNAASTGMVIYPSPATDKLFAIIDHAKDQSISVSIFNTTGQLVFSNSLLMNNHTLEIPVSSLSSGVYMYSIDAGGFVHHGKFVKE